MEATASPSKEGSSMGVGKGEGQFERDFNGRKEQQRNTSMHAWSSSVIFEKGYFRGLQSTLGRQQYI
jgi:hypothetical protein